MLKEGKAERIQRPGLSRLLPPDFAERAPTDQGVDELIDWLDENLHNAIKQEVDARKDYLPMETLDPMTKRSLEGLLEDYAFIRSRVLWRYVDTKHALHQEKDSEVKERWAKARAKMPEGLRKKMDRFTPEWQRRRLQTLEVIIHDLRLDGEKDIIDDLFEQAAAISVESGQVVEGELIKPPV